MVKVVTGSIKIHYEILGHEFSCTNQILCLISINTVLTCTYYVLITYITEMASLWRIFKRNRIKLHRDQWQYISHPLYIPICLHSIIFLHMYCEIIMDTGDIDSVYYRLFEQLFWTTFLLRLVQFHGLLYSHDFHEGEGIQFPTNSVHKLVYYIQWKIFFRRLFSLSMWAYCE